MNKIDCIKKDQSLIHHMRQNFLDCGIVALRLNFDFVVVRRGSREDRHSLIPILLAFGEISHFEGGRATP